MKINPSILYKEEEYLEETSTSELDLACCACNFTDMNSEDDALLLYVMDMFDGYDATKDKIHKDLEVIIECKHCKSSVSGRGYAEIKEAWNKLQQKRLDAFVKEDIPKEKTVPTKLTTQEFQEFMFSSNRGTIYKANEYSYEQPDGTIINVRDLNNLVPEEITFDKLWNSFPYVSKTAIDPITAYYKDRR